MAADEPYRGFEQGPIRPPSERDSLLVRVTRNCPWNRCTFCGLYKGERFSRRPVTHVLQDIDAVRRAVDRLTGASTPAASPTSTCVRWAARVGTGQSTSGTGCVPTRRPGMRMPPQRRRLRHGIRTPGTMPTPKRPGSTALTTD